MDVNEILLQYGILGVVVIGLAAAYLRLEKRMDRMDEKHEDERDQWLKKMEELFNRSDSTLKDTNSTIRESTNIISNLKTLFEVHLRDKPQK